MSIKNLCDYPFVSLSEDLAVRMISILIGEDPKVEQPVDKEFADSLGFIGKVFYARCSAHNIKLTCGLFFFLIATMRSPAHSTLWAWTLFNLQNDENHMLTIEDWAKAFPVGVPASESYDKAWQEQKGNGPGNNKLHDPANWVRGSSDEANDERLALSNWSYSSGPILVDFNVNK